MPTTNPDATDLESLVRVTQRFGWPSLEAILDPGGAGPAHQAQLLRHKIETALRRRPDAGRVRVGLLTRDSRADTTEDPLAVVCVFPVSPTPETLREAHRLAWSFSRARALLIVEPALLRVWTCCEAPAPSSALQPFPAELVPLSLADVGRETQNAVLRSLEWVRFTSGALFTAAPQRFRSQQCADRTLLENCRAVRRELITTIPNRPCLTEAVAHDLLARILFVQFLFHRRDSNGRPALGSHELNMFAAEGILSERYETLGQILRSHDDTYALFRWLDHRFNGDLFPGKRRGQAESFPAEGERAWRQEMAQVQPAHLALLADLVEGRLRLEKDGKQLHLWPLYAFDALPLDFISSIYEELVGDGTGVHYTPHLLVDFVLDEVLPWNGDTWDLKILDPACGSGIFLVKAFQRLVYRYRRANPGVSPTAQFLRRLLERNLMGVDIDDNAVRVASLSLYLAMCDELDARSYWKTMRLPSLYGSRLLRADFFAQSEGNPRRPDVSMGPFDLVVGNAPWGEETLTPAAVVWAREQGWDVPNRSIGPLFLIKGAALTAPQGFVAMLQPAGALLYNRTQVACRFRRKLFQTYEVEEVVDFSALRHNSFENSIAPTCAIVLQPVPPDESTVIFARARGHLEGGSRHSVIIEASDVHALEKQESGEDPWVWSALWHGSRRDLHLVHRLAKLPRSIGSLGRRRMGIVRGSDPEKRRSEPTIVGKRILDQPDFPDDVFLTLDADILPKNTDPYITKRDSSDLSAFQSPQLLIKLSRVQSEHRFRAVVVDNHGRQEGVLCRQSYRSVCVQEAQRDYLSAACLMLNSALAAYFLTLTGSRFAGFIPTALNQELDSLPVPSQWRGNLAALNNFADVDREVYELLRLPEADRVRVEDFMERQDPDNRGRPPDRQVYCDQLIRTLEQSGLRTSAMILQESQPADGPLAIVVLYLQPLPGDRIRMETISEPALRDRLTKLDRCFLRHQTNDQGAGGILFQRVARIYDVAQVGDQRIPAVYFIKPSRRDCWSRSAALDDADSLVAEALYAGRPWRGWKDANQ